MASGFVRWSACSRWIAAIGLAAALPGCDVPAEECDGAFRSAEFEGFDEGPNDGPLPGVIDADRGSPDIFCPKCGSHWTVSGGTPGAGNITGGVFAVYLDPELGQSISDLTEAGSFFYRHLRGQFGTVVQGPGEGYTLPIHGMLPDNADHLSEAHFGTGTATLVIVHEKVPVYVQLKYVNNANGEFEDPPDFN
ncbi:MAG: hypothetical protein ACRBN8_44095 [Nannocystales bacterium]